MSKRKLGRPAAHRKAMMRGLATFLLENGKIKTTITKAKELGTTVEKIITTSKNKNLHSKRKVLSFITKESVVKKLFDEIVNKYINVNGGYTRITKLGTRKGDAANMAVIELI